jgi:hypothetical protein
MQKLHSDILMMFNFKNTLSKPENNYIVDILQLVVVCIKKITLFIKEISFKNDK